MGISPFAVGGMPGGADAKGSALKAGSSSAKALSSAASAPRVIQGKHSDGQPLWLMCQVRARSRLQCPLYFDAKVSSGFIMG